MNKLTSVFEFFDHVMLMRKHYLILDAAIKDPPCGKLSEDILAMIEDKEQLARSIVRLVVYGELE